MILMPVVGMCLLITATLIVRSRSMHRPKPSHLVKNNSNSGSSIAFSTSHPEMPANKAVEVSCVLPRAIHAGKSVAMATGSRQLEAIVKPTIRSEVDALALLRTVGPVPGRSLQGLQAQKNRLMDHLVSMPYPPSNLTDILIGLYEDLSQDVVTRDYAIQHLSLNWYSRAGSAEQIKIRDVLRSASMEHASTIGGTALLGMTRLSRESNAFIRDELNETVLKAAADETASELTRITAVRLWGTLKISDAKVLSKKLAEDADSLPLAMAAASTYRELDGSSPQSQALHASVMSKSPCVGCQN